MAIYYDSFGGDVDMRANEFGRFSGYVDV